MFVSRRSFLQTSASIALASQIPSKLRGKWTVDEVRVAVEVAHSELWRRFVDSHGVLLDYTDLDGSVSLPTPEECRKGQPNANGWWTPIENGAMFNGLYLDGAVNRALATGVEADKQKARRLVEGLLRLSSCSDVEGFIGRGFASDGETTWPLGSSDQTSPWFYGLWRYLESGLGDDAFRQQILAKMVDVAETLARNNWKVPSEPPFSPRGSFVEFSWEASPRLLFICKAMHQLTGKAVWEQRYLKALHEDPPNGLRTRLQDCERGMVFERGGIPKPGRASWTGSASVVCLRGLWDMEKDTSLRASFATGLRASAEMAVAGMSYRKDFPIEDDSYFEMNWRKLNAYWKPQKTIEEARTLAQFELKVLADLSPRRQVELKFAREAIFAAWVITLCPDPAVIKLHEPEIHATFAHFQADKLYVVSFFPMESAWWRLVNAN